MNAQETKSERIILLVAREMISHREGIADAGGDGVEAWNLYATFIDDFDPDPEIVRLCEAGALTITEPSGKVHDWRDPSGARAALDNHHSVVRIDRGADDEKQGCA